MQHEQVNKYNELVEMQIEALDKRDYDYSKKLHEEAIQVLPSGVETYYQQAYALYKQQNFESSIEFINYNILDNEKLELSEAKTAEIYYLMAENYMGLKEYGKAVLAYERLFKHGGYDCIYYRDYAIALAYDKNYKKAEQVLNQAIEYGLTDDSIYYAKGEIENVMGKQKEAISHFRQCIEITESNDLIEKAYLMLSKVYEEQGALKEQRNILQEAVETLPVMDQIVILEKLAQVNINLADQFEQGRYRDEAISVLEKIIKQGWDTYNTYNNLVILNQKQGYLNEAESNLEIMRQMFGEDYNIYKRYAFLEIEKQELKENSQRNYSTFEKYYNAAMRMYQESSVDNNTDAEMQLLDNVYYQMKSGGWL